jgi:hypothetical protein
MVNVPLTFVASEAFITKCLIISKNGEVLNILPANATIGFTIVTYQRPISKQEEFSI